jgi:hypothetical protein
MRAWLPTVVFSSFFPVRGDVWESYFENKHNCLIWANEEPQRDRGRWNGRVDEIQG